METAFLIRIQLHNAESSDYAALYKRLKEIKEIKVSAAIEIGAAPYKGSAPSVYAMIHPPTPYDGLWQLPNAEYFCKGEDLHGPTILKLIKQAVDKALNEELSALNENIKASGEQVKILISHVNGVVHSGLTPLSDDSELL